MIFFFNHIVLLQKLHVIYQIIRRLNIWFCLLDQKNIRKQIKVIILLGNVLPSYMAVVLY